MESSIAEFLSRKIACERLPTVRGRESEGGRLTGWWLLGCVAPGLLASVFEHMQNLLNNIQKYANIVQNIE